MDIIGGIEKLLHRCFSQYPLMERNDSFNPVMRQRPLIDAGNTGRYALDAFQIAFNSPAGGGTLVSATFGHTGVGSPDVSSQYVPTLAGMGTIPQTPGTQGLVPGLRDTSL